MTQAIDNVKLGKSPGQDEITAEMIEYVGEASKNEFCGILRTY